MRTPLERWEERQAFFLPLARRVTALEGLPPGPRLMSELREIRDLPMTEELALRCVALWERCEAWLAAQKMVFFGEADRTGPAELPLLAEEVAALTRSSFANAVSQLALTRQVARSLGLAWEALERGELTLAHVKALGRSLEGFPFEVAERVDAALVPQAIEHGWAPSELGRAAGGRAAIEADPDGASERAAIATTQSDVKLFPGHNDQAHLGIDGEAATLRQVMDCLDEQAEQLRRDGDKRPIGLRRVTALANAVLGKDGAKRPRTQLLLTLDLPTYLGLTDRPGELSGYGPITAELARQLSENAELRRLITDPITGTVIDVGRRTYRPTRLIRKIVEAVHPTCRFPGCSRPAIACDCDHRCDWRDGGHTSTRNLHPLCRRHHNLQTRQLWSVEINPDGAEVWTSRLGFRFVKQAATYPSELLEPPPDDDPPAEIADRVPEHDSDPPIDEWSLPEPPPLTEEEREAFGRAVDELEFRAWLAADRGYDNFRDLGLIA